MNVRGPDGAVIAFPDEMPPDQVEAALRTHYARHTSLGKMFPRVGELRDAVREGTSNVAQSIPASLMSLASLPNAVATGAANLATDPVGTVKAAAGAVPDALASMIPMRETGKGLIDYARGKAGPPALKTAEREATELIESQLLGKYVPEAVKGAARATRKLPGAAVALHEMAIPEVQAVPKGLRPSEASVKGAFAQAATKGAPPIWMGNLRRAARNLLRHEMENLGPASRDSQLVGALRSFIEDTNHGWSPEQWKAELDRMGARLGGMPGAEGMSRVHDRQIRTLMRAMYKDIERGRVSKELLPAIPSSRTYEQAGGSGPPQWIDKPGVSAKHGPASSTSATIAKAAAWKDAQQLARRAHAVDELEGMVNRPGVISVVGDQHRSLNINGVLRQIDQRVRLAQQVGGVGVKKAKRFVESFKPGELAAVRAKLQEIGGDLPRIPIGKGASHGSGGYILRGVIGEIAGSAVGHPLAGTAVGLASHALIQRAIMSPLGRQAIKAAARIDPSVGPQFQSMLAAFLRSQIPQPQPEPTPEPTPQAAAGGM